MLIDDLKWKKDQMPYTAIFRIINYLSNREWLQFHRWRRNSNQKWKYFHFVFTLSTSGACIGTNYIIVIDHLLQFIILRSKKREAQQTTTSALLFYFDILRFCIGNRKPAPRFTNPCNEARKISYLVVILFHWSILLYNDLKTHLFHCSARHYFLGFWPRVSILYSLWMF